MMLYLHRIRADHKLAEIFNARHHRAGFAFERSFAPANDALIGLELYEYVRPVGIGR